MKLVKLCGDDAQDRVDWRIGISRNRLAHARPENQTGKPDVKTMMMKMMK